LSLVRRWGIVGGAFAVAVALIAWFFTWIVSYPPTVAVAATNGAATLTLQTVGTIGFGTHPSWVSYLVQQNGRWIHTTIYQLPAHSTVNVTVYEYDTQGPLRNQELGLPTGVQEYVNGKPLTVSNAGGNTAPAHTFTVPALGINVPLVGVPASAKNLCSAAPCQPSSDHTTVTFAIHTGNPGVFRWQCFVPCGLSFLDGNGGPMTTLGYMGGFLKVVSA
jgi:hypothetical protein